MIMSKNNNVFEVLSSIDVTNYLETKHGGLKYLSWAAAWGLVKQHYPNAEYKVITDDENNIAHLESSGGYFVKTEVTIEGLTHTEVLPVLNSNNKPLCYKPYTYSTKSGKEIKVEAITSFDINSAYKRCLVKACAMHGLGLQVFVNGQGHGLDLNNKSVVTSAPAKVSTSLF